MGRMDRRRPDHLENVIIIEGGSHLHTELARPQSSARHGLIYKNALMLLASQLNQGLSYLYVIIVGRLRGPEFYGTLRRQ